MKQKKANVSINLLLIRYNGFNGVNWMSDPYQRKTYIFGD